MHRYLLLIIILLGCTAMPVEQAKPTSTPVPTPPASTPLTQTPVLKWQVTVGPGLRASAQTAGGQVIVATDTAVLAYDPASGTETWRVEPVEGVWRRSLAARGSLVIVGLPQQVLALDAASGNELWRQQIQGDLLWPALITDDSVLLGSAFVGPDAPPVPEGKGVVYRLNSATGAVLWSVETAAYTLVTPAVSGSRVVAAGSMLGDSEIEEGGHLRIHLFDLENGRLQWQIDREDGFVKTLAADDRHIYFLAYTDLVYGLAISDGSEAWRYPTENWSPGFDFAAGELYFGSDNAFVHAVNGQTGTAVWREPLTGVFNAPRSPIVAVDDFLYFQSNDNRLYCLDRTSGKVVWQTEPQARSLFTPTIGFNHLYLVGQDGILYAYGEP